MARFAPHHRKFGGRVRGTPNRSTIAGREFAAKLCGDPDYLASVAARAKAGKLPPGIEAMLWHYAVGKPREMLEVSGSVSGRDVSAMSTDELLSELEQHNRATTEFLTQHYAQRLTQDD